MSDNIWVLHYVLVSSSFRDTLDALALKERHTALHDEPKYDTLRQEVPWPSHLNHMAPTS